MGNALTLGCFGEGDVLPPPPPTMIAPEAGEVCLICVQPDITWLHTLPHINEDAPRPCSSNGELEGVCGRATMVAAGT